MTESIYSKNKKTKLIFFSVLGIALCLTIFLTVSLITFYFKNIKKNKDNNLFYVFRQNTLTKDYVVDPNADISEQYLSYGISYGIDVSEWQGEIDWQKVASTGISFAMIRCGWRGTVGSTMKEDEYFRRNIEGAQRAGLNVGVYFFGTARTKEEALEEAEFTFNLIKDYNLTYPVVYDVESFHEGRLLSVDYSTISDNVLLFTETLADYGYQTMIYTYKNAMTGILDMGKFDGKLIWLAHFAEETDYQGNYNMWQYTDEGRVDGIDTFVDLNISYFKYVDSESEVVPNPNYVNAPKVLFNEVNDEVKVTKKTELHSSATKELPNTLGSIKRGTILKRTGISSEFSRIIYNERVAYIENSAIAPIT